MDRAVSNGRTADQLTAALLIGTTAFLPLLFVPGVDDGYALPKAVLLRVGAVAVALGFLLQVVLGDPPTVRFDRWIDGSLAAFAALITMSTVVSVDASQSIFGEPFQYQGLVTVLIYVGGFYAARMALSVPRRFGALVMTHVAVGGVVAGYAIAQTFGLDPFWSGPPEERAISSVGQANDLAAYLDLVIVVGLGSWGRSGKAARLPIAIVVGLSVVALALTFSRGGFLGLIAAAVVVLAFRWRTFAARNWHASRIAVVVTVGLLAGAVITGPWIVRVAERVGTTADTGESSIRVHLESWRVGLAIASDRPLLGTGPETFPLVFADYLDGVLPPDRADYLRRFRLESPHNEWIGIAAESGFTALVVYLVFLGALAFRFAARARAGPTLGPGIALVALATLAVHVITTGFKTPDTSTSLLFWVVVGAALATSDRELESRRTERELHAERRE